MLIELNEGALQSWRHEQATITLDGLRRHCNQEVRGRAAALAEALLDGNASDPMSLFEDARDLSNSPRVDERARREFARLSYIVSRSKTSAWEGFMPYALDNCRRSENKFKESFDIEDVETPKIPKIIRQCRPNIDNFTTNVTRQIGFYNKNRNFIYRNYDGQAAESYIRENVGDYAGKLFASLSVPQAQSDLFLIASLFVEGGISADVCSINRASIAPLLDNRSSLGFVLTREGPEKKFFFSIPRHPFVKAYLERLLDYADRSFTGEIVFNYEEFSSTKAFRRFFMDMVCGSTQITDTDSIFLIDEATYEAFVNASTDEEVLLHEDDNLPYGRTRLIGIADDLTLRSSFRSPRRGDAIVASLPGHYFGPSDSVTVVGHNKTPDIARQARTPYAHASVHLFQTYNIMLSGHGCLWKDQNFLRLDSYLSWVGEQETLGGHWRGPHNAEITREIEEPTIVAFGAGYGCYGHYLVDDLPRLGLSKRLLGEEAFLKRKIVIPTATPRWAIGLLTTILQVPEENFLFFDHEREFWLLRDAIVPSYLSRHYRFHPALRTFFQSLAPDVGRPWRRLCLSRRAWEPHKVNQRIFEQQEIFENMARERGFEIVMPETMSIPDQIRMLAETRCQIGEHGSAQHASIYNRHGMTIGTINPLTEVQTNLGRLYNDRNVLAYEDSSRRDGNENIF